MKVSSMKEAILTLIKFQRGKSYSYVSYIVLGQMTRKFGILNKICKNNGFRKYRINLITI